MGAREERSREVLDALTAFRPSQLQFCHDGKGRVLLGNFTLPIFLEPSNERSSEALLALTAVRPSPLNFTIPGVTLPGFACPLFDGH